MGKSGYFILMGLVTAILICQSGIGDELQVNTPNEKPAIATAEEAVQRAFEYTGFDKSKGFSVKESIGEVKLEIATDTITPFLHDSIDGRTIWSVEFNGILLNPKSIKPEKIEANPKRFEVWLDAETGILLRVFSPYTGSDSTGLSVITAEQAESKLRASNEEYRDFVDSIPPVSCFDALNADRFGSPMFAKEIHAVCVLNSIPRTEEAKPMWIISLREPPASPLDIDYRHRLPGKHTRRSRILVDAQTGEIIIVQKRFSPLKLESE
jgi:hypothetical protein